MTTWRKEQLAFEIGDPCGQILSITPSFAALLGYSPEYLIGRRFWELMPPSQIEQRVSRFVTAMAGGISYKDQAEYVCQDGSRLKLVVNVMLIKDASDVIQAVAIIPEGIDRLAPDDLPVSLSAVVSLLRRAPSETRRLAEL